MKSETQPVNIVSITHQETATPASEFLLPPLRMSHWRFFLRDEPSVSVFFRAEYTQPEVGSGQQNLKKLPQMPPSGFLSHSG